MQYFGLFFDAALTLLWEEVTRFASIFQSVTYDLNTCTLGFLLFLVNRLYYLVI